MGDVVIFYDHTSKKWVPSYVQKYTPGSVYVNLVEIWASERSVGRVHDVDTVFQVVWTFVGPVRAP